MKIFRRRDYIVSIDLDSTLCDTRHRHHMIDREKGTNWHEYSAACEGDTPVEGMVALVQLLAESGHEVHGLSGRKVSALEATLKWFSLHGVPIKRVWLDETDTGDYGRAEDHVAYKLERAREVERVTGKKIALHIDDWAGVTKAFNAAGIPSICVRTPTEVEELAGNETPETKVAGT